MIFLICLALIIQINLIQCVYWQPNDWAFACDFYNNDLKNVLSAASQCGPKCLAEPSCTHFTWTKYNGGTCWMKKGVVSKSNAFDTNDGSMVCGLILAKMSSSSTNGQLVWSDEFNYNGKPNSNEWTAEIGNSGYGNNELQYYTDFNANSDGQYLTINTLKQNYGTARYTSSRYFTKKTFTYGVFEMRAKLPRGRGTWPAFWLLSANNPLNWPYDGEIDIMEHVGFDPNKVHATIHCQSYYGGNGKTSTITVNDVFDTFHTYKVDWNPKRIRAYVDDKEYFVYYNDNQNNKNTWPYNKPMKIIINNAVGGNWGGAQGVDDSIFPTKYVIDYIRVYAANNNP